MNIWKRRLLFLAVLLPVMASAQTNDTVEKEIVRGWSVGAFPTISISNTLGFQYGLFGSLFYYGDGSTYPDPLHKFTAEASHFTGGRSRFYVTYDSKYLIPNWRLTLSALYMIDPLAFFYGFNGAAQPYDDFLDDHNYYCLDRRFLQVFANFQRELNDHLKIAGGLTFSRYKIADYDTAKYGTPAPLPTTTLSLYHNYINLGLISNIKMEAGVHTEVVSDVLDTIADVIRAETDENMEIYTSGANNIFRYPELADSSRASQLIGAIEDKNGLADLVKMTQADESDETGIQVYIGEESAVESMRDCSVVTATYDLGDGMQGTIGIIGPKRMDYEKVMSNLKQVKESLNDAFRSER